MSNNSASTGNGLGLFGAITVVLLVFKLAGMAGASWGLANLSWWWVFAPALVGTGLFVVVVIALIFLAMSER